MKVYIIAEEDSVEGGHTIRSVHATADGAATRWTEIIDAEHQRLTGAAGRKVADYQRLVLERELQVLEWEVAP